MSTTETDGNFAIPQASSPLAFTGERMTGAVSGQIEFEHLHRYCLARDFCAGRDVLDVASGEGYGSAILAGVARTVVGVELDAASVRHAESSYRLKNLRFEQGDALALPLPADSIDVVVSFETIEHLPDVSRFLDEIQRVLRPGGLLLISTPDRTVYSAAGSDPNPYHILEMTEAEFRNALSARFAHLEVAAQRPVLGSVMAASSEAWRSYERRAQDRAEASPGLSRAPYLVALASNVALPALPSSVYLDHHSVHDVVEATAEVAALRAEVARVNAALSEAWAHQATLETERDTLVLEHDTLRAELAAAAERQAATQAAHGRALLTEQADAARRQDAAQTAHRLEMASRDHELASSLAELAVCQASASAFRHEWASAEARAEGLARDAEQHGRHGEHLLALLAERAAEWERANVVFDGQRTELSRVSAALEIAERERNALLRSTSWRMSRPIRIAGTSLRTAAHAARLPQRALSARALRRRRSAEIAALRATPLFDAEWYLDHVPGLRGSGQDPAAHYAWIGSEAGFMPNPYFDSAWYRAQNPDLALGDENALLHWVREGATRQLNPNPFLQTIWYVARHPEAASDPLLHWVEHGVPDRLDPNPMLDAEAYLLEYPAARDSGLDAMLHWWRQGATEGLNPHPMFEAAFYRQRHGLTPAEDPLAHWLQVGEAQGLVTSPILALADKPLTTLAFTPEPDPLVSIIIPAYAHYADTWRCLYSVMANTNPSFRYEVIVADDCPEHRVAPLLQRRIPGVRWRQNPENLGFLRSCNAAEKLATGTYIVFLNNDAEVHPGWLEPLVQLAEQDVTVGIVGCKLLNTDGTLQEAGGTILNNGWGEPYGSGDDPDRPEYNFVRDVDVVVGACFLVRRAAFDAFGGFDLRYAPAFYEEFDLAFGLRQAGYRTVYQPKSRVTHHGSNSYGSVMRDRQSLINQAKFCAKWKHELAGQRAPDAPVLLRRQRPHRAGIVLVIDDRVPEWNRQAGALTIHVYIGLLQTKGYTVVFGAAADPRPLQPYLGDMQQSGIEVLLSSTAIEAWLRTHGEHLDYVWVARPDVAGRLLPAIRSTTKAPILYYTHDLHYLRERRRWHVEGDPAALEESKRLMRIEHDIFRSVDQVMTPSSAEAELIRNEVPGASVHVIPPYVVKTGWPEGADTPLPDQEAEQVSVMFVGGFAHLPNVDAAIWLATTIMPLVWATAPEIRAVIVGAAPPSDLCALKAEQIEVMGFVENLAPLYARSFCTVSPLRYGAGVKGKIIGSIEAHVPVVTTSVGNEGIDLQNGTEALIADTQDAIAAAVLSLWKDRSLRKRLASTSLLRICERYSVDAATIALSAVLDAAVAGDAAPLIKPTLATPGNPAS